MKRDRIDAELFNAALSLFEGDERAARHWLLQPQRAFAGRRPVDVEPDEVIRLIDQLEHGIGP